MDARFRGHDGAGGHDWGRRGLLGGADELCWSWRALLGWRISDWYDGACGTDRVGGFYGGGGGIRTPETCEGLPVFKTGAINRSATPPLVFVSLY